MDVVRAQYPLKMKEGPSGSAIRSLVPSHRERLWSKAMVVSVAEKRGIAEELGHADEEFSKQCIEFSPRSLLITANQPFGEWGKIFSDQAMTLAAIDRLVHHARILEMNVEISPESGAQAQAWQIDLSYIRTTFVTGVSGARRDHNIMTQPRDSHRTSSA